jgi:hypothetical protein
MSESARQMLYGRAKADGLFRIGQGRSAMATTGFPIRMVAGRVMAQATRARWATVRVETDGGEFVGRIFVPETKKRATDMLCDERPFIFLTEVSVNRGETIEPFLAVNKRYIKTVRVLHEGEPEAIPQGAR